MNALAQPASDVAPLEKASQLLGIVREIDAAMTDSKVQVTEIEARGYLKNLFSSSREDLLAHAKSQNRVNALLVRLNQDVVAVNTMGYAYLASVIAEFEHQVNEGSKDSDGRIHVLSDNGKRVAQMAKEMFAAILDGSQSTQERIDANTAAVLEFKEMFAGVAEKLSLHAARASALEDFRSLTVARLEEHALLALRHGETLDQSHEAIKTLLRHRSGLNDRLDEFERSHASLRDEIASLRTDLSSVDAREAAVRKRLHRTVWTMVPVVVALAISCVALGMRAMGGL